MLQQRGNWYMLCLSCYHSVNVADKHQNHNEHLKKICCNINRITNRLLTEWGIAKQNRTCWFTIRSVFGLNKIFLFPTDGTCWPWTSGLWVVLHWISPLSLPVSTSSDWDPLRNSQLQEACREEKRKRRKNKRDKPLYVHSWGLELIPRRRGAFLWESTPQLPVGALKSQAGPYLTFFEEDIAATGWARSRRKARTAASAIFKTCLTPVRDWPEGE